MQASGPWIDLAYLGLGLHTIPFEFELGDDDGAATGWALHFHDRTSGAVFTYHNPELSRRGVIVVRVAGIGQYPGSQGKQAALGARLLVQPEPENAYDAKAVALLDEGGVTVGHVPATECDRVNARLGAGEHLAGMVICEAGGGGCRVLIDAALFPLPAQPVAAAAAQWFPDPDDQTMWRWWDGRQWTDDRAPRGPTA